VRVKCVVAGNAGCGPCFMRVTVAVTSEQYDDGVHYDKAREVAKKQHMDPPFVVFDSVDGPAWLFAHMFDGTCHEE
jgi:hypothetical protein